MHRQARKPCNPMHKFQDVCKKRVASSHKYSVPMCHGLSRCPRHRPCVTIWWPSPQIQLLAGRWPKRKHL